MQWWELPRAKEKHIEQRLSDSDGYIRQAVDLILELQANAEHLSDILQKLKEEDG